MTDNLRNDTLSILKKYDLFAKKKLGQNFLVDESALAEIVKAAALTKEDDVVEIGPGLGTLTKALAPACRRLTSIEYDKILIPILTEELSNFNNIELIHQDALKFPLYSLILLKSL